MGMHTVTSIFMPIHWKKQIMSVYKYISVKNFIVEILKRIRRLLICWNVHCSRGILEVKLLRRRLLAMEARSQQTSYTSGYPDFFPPPPPPDWKSQSHHANPSWIHPYPPCLVLPVRNMPVEYNWHQALKSSKSRNNIIISPLIFQSYDLGKSVFAITWNNLFGATFRRCSDTIWRGISRCR